MDTLRGSLTPHATMRCVLGSRQRIAGNMREGGGTSNYEELENLPAINGIELIGDQSAHDLGLALLTDIPDLDYSTNEIDTGIKWIDGKSIYRRVFELTNISNIINLTLVENVISARAMIWGTGAYSDYFWYAPYNDGDYAQFVKRDTGYLTLILSAWFVNNTSKVVAIADYTKP